MFLDAAKVNITHFWLFTNSCFSKKVTPHWQSNVYPSHISFKVHAYMYWLFFILVKSVILIFHQISSSIMFFLLVPVVRVWNVLRIRDIGVRSVLIDEKLPRMCEIWKEKRRPQNVMRKGNSSINKSWRKGS